MPTHTQSPTVLVASRDPHLADVRKRILEAAGFGVLPVTKSNEVESACTNHQVDLVLLGYSLAPADKRRIAYEARKHCKTPILELYNGNPPELHEDSRMFHHHSNAPEDFLEAVKSLIAPAEHRER